MPKYICLARKSVEKGLVEVNQKIEFKENDIWLEIETELGKIPFKIIKKSKDGEQRFKGNSNNSIGNMTRILDQSYISSFDKLEKFEEKALGKFTQKIKKYQLEMKPVATLLTSDDQQIIFYFTAQQRVDFRRLVKELASSFNRVIRLQHINNRQARMIVGGIGPCGREICCHRGVIDILEEVPSSLLGSQDLNGVDSTKLSGLCDKLVCCLKYENQIYQELKKQLPNIGSKIKRDGKTGLIKDINPLKQTVLVEFEDGVKKEINIS